MKRYAVLLFGSIAASQELLAAGPSLSLRAENSPMERPWEEGATIAYNNSDGESAAIADAELKVGYEFDSKPLAAGALGSKALLGGYWHRNTDDDKERNDRGASFSYVGTYVPAFDPSGGVHSLGWMVQGKFGKSLKKTDVNGVTQEFDLDSDRQIIKASYYYQPPIPGTPAARHATYFFGIDTGIYSDNLDGSNVTVLDGRVTGVIGHITASLAPFGLDVIDNPIGAGSLGIAPLLTFSAQGQHDVSSTGGRKEETRRLYSVSLNLRFGKRDQDKTLITPSLILSRSTGSDVLTGRPDQGVTKIAFSVLF